MAFPIEQGLQEDLQGKPYHRLKQATAILPNIFELERLLSCLEIRRELTDKSCSKNLEGGQIRVNLCFGVIKGRDGVERDNRKSTTWLYALYDHPEVIFTRASKKKKDWEVKDQDNILKTIVQRYQREESNAEALQEARPDTANQTEEELRQNEVKRIIEKYTGRPAFNQINPLMAQGNQSTDHLNSQLNVEQGVELMANGLILPQSAEMEEEARNTEVFQGYQPVSIKPVEDEKKQDVVHEKNEGDLDNRKTHYVEKENFEELPKPSAKLIEIKYENPQQSIGKKRKCSEVGISGFKTFKMVRNQNLNEAKTIHIKSWKAKKPELNTKVALFVMSLLALKVVFILIQ